jgi:hypothetical protein
MRVVPAIGDALRMVGDYMNGKTGASFREGEYQGFAFLSDSGAFSGAAVISNYRNTDCEVSFAVETPMAHRPHCHRAVFRYIFEQLGCVRCTCITTRNNKAARTLLEKLGFELEGNIRKGYDGRRNALIYGLLATDCKLLGEASSGEEKRPGTATSTGPGSDGSGAIATE